MKKKIAIVSSDILGPVRNGGVGTSCALLAEHLASNGYEVDLIFASEKVPEDFQKWQTFYRSKNIDLKPLNPISFVNDNGHYWVRLSYQVFEHLKNTHYDLVISPDMWGVCYFSLVARRTGLFFQRTKFLVKFLGPQLWSREANLELMGSHLELSVPILERGVVENADCVQFATDWSVKWAHENNWNYRDSVKALFPFLPVPNPVPNRKSPKEIVFFGRLEYRKGLKYFLSALEILKSNGALAGRTVTLMGCEGSIEGRPALHFVERWQRRTEIPLKIITDKQSFEAISYLKKRNTLAVVASTSETMGYTLLECLAHNIPVVCSDIDPFKEILGPLGETGMFRAKDPQSLADCLQKNKFFLGKKRAKALYSETGKRWIKIVSETLAGKPELVPMAEKPTVSVLITHHDRAEYLQQALQSLLEQTEMPLEVLVYDDASKTKAFQKAITDFSPRFSQQKSSLKLFEGKENRGPCHGRNFLVGKATGQFILFMDDDNLALHHEIASLRTAQSFIDADAVCPSMIRFYDGQEKLWKERRWSPVGFQLTSSLVENLMGDTNCLVRRDLFLKLNGFDEANDIRAEDMNLLIRLAKSGAKMTVCPEPTYKYRVHRSNRSHDLGFHEARLHNLKTIFSSLPGQEKDVASHLFLAWSYNQGIFWGPEGSPKLKDLTIDDQKKALVLNDSIRKKVFKKFIKPFGKFQALQFDKHRKILIDLSKIKETGKQGYLNLVVLSEKTTELRPSNGFQKIPVHHGMNQIVIGIDDCQKEASLEIGEGSHKLYLLASHFFPFDESNV